MKYLESRDIAGDVVARYPDFDCGEFVVILPDRVSNAWPSDAGSMVQTGRIFVGPTRHPYAAVVRETRFGTTVHVQRDQLRPSR